MTGINVAEYVPRLATGDRLADATHIVSFARVARLLAALVSDAAENSKIASAH